MKRIIAAGLVLAWISPAYAASHRVGGYVKRNGAYVAPHRQTNPNRSRLDNYSTRGNVNPYTGKAGTVSPYKVRPYTPRRK